MNRRIKLFVGGAGGLLAAAFVVVALIAIVDSGWRDPYADQWRMYPIYLELPFPDNVLQLENGHRPILPGLVRHIELRWFAGSQTLQLTIGALAALLTVVLLSWVAVRDHSLGPIRRGLAVATAAAGVFWLGNGRFLLHGNESGHGYLLTACTALAIVVLLRRGTHPQQSLLLACTLAMAATFCFGPGIAAFGALALLLLLDRRYRDLSWLGLAFVLTLALYLVLPDAGGVRSSLQVQPLVNLGVASAWLASMWVHLLQAFHDPDAARALPGWLATATTPIAEGYRQQFGSLWQQPAPATGLGLIAITYVGVVTLACLRGAHAGPLRRTGLAVAWFAIGVSAVVALSRLDYFSAHPDQIMAQRYLPWSSLFWLGLLLTALATPKQASTARTTPVVIVSVLLVGMVVSTPAYRAWGQRVQDGLALQAAGIAVGTLSTEQPLWESRLDEIERARPLLQRQRLAMFAWPEMRIDPAAAVSTPIAHTQVLTIAAERIDNRFGGEALALTARMTEGSDVASDQRRLLITDADGQRLGLLVRQRDRSGALYSGYAAPSATRGDISRARVLALRDGKLYCLADCASNTGSSEP